MTSRFVTVVLLLILGLIHYQTLVGSENNKNNHDIKLNLAKTLNKNKELEVEVARLQKLLIGLINEAPGSIEDSYRKELGYLKNNEIFVKITK